ncbi:F0F1 ATP synthase subunit gamma [Pseudooceanicola sp. 200-1SW]|uniref:F0F1 ATP synthase subunit gamma n=1 Tax=Pseudooceanicola sp. 200-1SW TaxID=3425949 RepID=UPI003D7FE2B2
MSGRLAEVEGRIDTVRKLSSVIGAMRGIAAARAQEARAHLDSIRRYAETIGAGIGQAMALMPEGDAAGLTDRGARASQAPGDPGHGLILLAAEQGFVGTYNERLFDAAAPYLTGEGPVFLLGDRGVLLAAERGRPLRWSAPMVTHPDQVPRLATRLTEAIFAPLAEGRMQRLTLLHARPGMATDPGGGEGQMRIVTRPLLPFDYSRFPPPASARAAPMLTLPPADLLAGLVEEYVFSELSEAIMMGFAAENEARMRAMIAARANVMDSLNSLTGEARRLRQDEITDEIVELAAGQRARQ